MLGRGVLQALSAAATVAVLLCHYPKVVRAGNSQCTDSRGVTAPCAPGNSDCNASAPPPLPRYHVIDYSCGENDPNGPCYDEKHGVYHLFYQDHLGIGGGITWGHVVSRNLTTWARVGVGVWNDQPYDRTAIYSGSCVNSVHGQMTLIYPGVCPKGSSPACLFGTTVNLAVPADPSDALSRNFSKLSVNPIAQVNGSVGPGGGGPPGGGGDSSAAWQTASGEWRLLTRDQMFSNVWESSDFSQWVNLGPQPGFTQGACPSFFPLPNRTAGAPPPPPGVQDPTHVYLYGDTTLLPSTASHRTVLVVGTYTEHGKGKLASFTPTPGITKGLTPQISDNGTYYAAKDFWDPKNGRRILWGWAQIPNGAQALPRHISWHPQLQQLLFSPLAEQAALRHSPIFPDAPRRLSVGGQAGSTAAIGSWAGGAAQQAEMLASFTLPSHSVSFGVRILGVLEAFVEFVPKSSRSSRGSAASTSRPSAAIVWNVQVGIRTVGGDTPAGGSGALLTRYMADTDLLGGDYNKNARTGRHLPPGTDPKVCQAECDAADKCVAWTYVIRGSPKGSGDCCLKKINATGHEAKLNLCPRHSNSCTSGVKTPRTEPHCQSGGGSIHAEAKLSLLSTDRELEIRAFTDHSILEVFFMDGRVALTVPLPHGSNIAPNASFALFADDAKAEISALVAGWQVGSIWVTPQQVIDSER